MCQIIVVVVVVVITTISWIQNVWLGVFVFPSTKIWPDVNNRCWCIFFFTLFFVCQRKRKLLQWKWNQLQIYEVEYFMTIHIKWYGKIRTMSAKYMDFIDSRGRGLIQFVTRVFSVLKILPVQWKFWFQFHDKSPKVTEQS